MSDQPITESKKRQRTPKGAAEDKSAKKLKEDKKQLQQKSHEELQREETFKSWLTGLHKRRKVSVWFHRKWRRKQIRVQKWCLCFVVKSYVWVRDGFSFSYLLGNTWRAPAACSKKRRSGESTEPCITRKNETSVATGVWSKRCVTCGVSLT